MDGVENAVTSPLQPVEAFAQGIVSAVPIRQFKDWISAYFHPAEALSAQADKGVAAIAIHLALIGLIGALMGLISLAVLMLYAPSLLSTSLLIAIPIMVIGYPIAAVILGFVASAVYLVFAKILGGKGGFLEQAYGMALVSGGTLLLALPFQLLGMIPLIGALFSLVVLAIELYGLYSQYRVIKTVHSLSSLRAVAVLVLPLLILGIILVGALTSIALLGFFPSVASNAVQTQSNAYWKSTTPFAILDSTQTGTSMTLYVQNMKATESYTITGLTVGSGKMAGTANVLPGETKTISIAGLPSCSGTYSYPVVITYETAGHASSQYGAKMLTGKCA